MSTKKSCISCRHCCGAQSVSDTWCRLRQIRVHSEISNFAFCHHWTKKEAVLPMVQAKNTHSYLEHQLEIDRQLAVIDNQ